MAEWLRRWTANPMCSARVGSNPILVDDLFCLEVKHWVLTLQQRGIKYEIWFQKVFFKLFVEFPSPACFCFECYSSADFRFREGKFLKRIQREERLGITPGQRAFFLNVLLASILKLFPLFPNMHPSLYMYLNCFFGSLKLLDGITGQGLLQIVIELSTLK